MYKLNSAQKQAVTSTSKKILCLAGAGTGKTRTVVERIVNLVDSGVNPKAILALTFTNAAAFEMKSRYREYKPDEEIPEFRTFHSFCYDLLSSNKGMLHLLGFSSMPLIAEEFFEQKLLKQAILQTGIKLSEKRIKELDADITSGTASEQKNYTILKKAHTKLLRNKGMITFDELCNTVCKLFIDDDPLIQAYKQRFQYIHVDEYQDTDRIQDAFVMSFIPSGASIFLVGDALQNLYSFRGSDSSIIKAIAEDPSWEVIRLSDNYRSTKPICDYANNFSKGYAKDSYRIPIVSIRSGEPVHERSQPLSRMYGAVDSKILQRITTECKALSDESIAILCRTNAECKKVQMALEDAGLMYVTAKQNMEAVHLLHSAADDAYLMDWLSTFLTAEHYSEYIRLSAIHKSNGSKYSGEEFLRDFGRLSAISERAEKISNIRMIAKDTISVNDRAAKILEYIGYPSTKVNLNSVMKVAKFLEKLWQAVAEEQDNTADIYVGTIHSSKGLEYDTVYVLGVDGNSFPLDSEDNNNVFYVAITRAKSRLIVYKC